MRKQRQQRIDVIEEVQEESLENSKIKKQIDVVLDGEELGTMAD